MGKRNIPFLVPILLLFCQGLSAKPAEGGFRAEALVETNVAYLALSALSTSPNNVFLVIPVNSQIMIAEKFSIDPSLVFVYNKNSSSKEDNFMVLFDLGASFHFGAGLQGWVIGLTPGVFYSFDSRLAGFSASIKSGYQWVLEKGLVLGVMLGGRYIYLDGTLVIPDLALNLGWRL